MLEKLIKYCRSESHIAIMHIDEIENKNPLVLYFFTFLV